MRDEPSSAELAGIVCEWPVIAAEVAVTDAECVLALRPGCGVALARWRAAVRRLRQAARVAGVQVVVPSLVWGVAV